MASIAYETMTAPVINNPSRPKEPVDSDNKVQAEIFELELSVWTSKFKVTERRSWHGKTV